MNPNVQLALDYVHQGAVDETSSFTFDNLIGSLAVVYLYIDEQSQQHVYAWYVSGMDLAMRLNAQSRAMFLAISELEVNAADGRFKAYHDVVEQFPHGHTYLAGPHADETARQYFNAFDCNTLVTPGGLGHQGVDVCFSVADKSWTLLRDGNAEANPQQEEPETQSASA